MGRLDRQVRVLSEDDVRASIDMASCIDACGRAFVAYSNGSAALPSVISLEVLEHQGEVHVKAGHLNGALFFAVKVAAGFPRNRELGLPTSDGLVVVFDARTGSPAAFLMDNGFITDLRTGAAGGVAAKHLAPVQVWNVGVIGTGAQARYQLDALAIVRPGFARVRVWGRDAERAAVTVDELRTRDGLPNGCAFDVAATVEEAVEDAEVVITCTASRAPLVRGDWLAPGAHVTAVGADDEKKQELEPSLLAGADCLVVDSRVQCARIGELHHALSAGLVDDRKAVELGEIVSGTELGRTSRDQLTVCDLTGVGAQDVAAANLVMDHAGDRGQLIEL
jgi:ornithine cyclodeaminase/alanine dehydrogenase-like protein (mu-crystallin family)